MWRKQRAERGRRRRRGDVVAEPRRRREAAGQQADRGALDITFDAGDLPGEAQPRHRLEPQHAVEQARAVEEGVAVQPAEPGELGALQPGDHAEDARLLAVPQLRLEADHVVERAERIVLAQLHDGMRPLSGARVAQADRLHRPQAQRVRAARRHDLDRQAALEIRRRFLPFVELGLLAGQQRRDERLVLLAVERAVDVVGCPRPCRSATGTTPRRNRSCRGRRSARSRRRRRALSSPVSAASASARAGEVSGPVAMMTSSHSGGGSPAISSRRISTSGSAVERRLDRLGKPDAIDRERAARRHLVPVGGGQDQRPATPHLLVQQTDRVALLVVGAERVRAHQLGEPGAEMRLGAPHRPHLVQYGQEPRPAPTATPPRCRRARRR